MECQNEIDVNGLKFRVHPVFYQYAGSRCGTLVNIDRETILLGNPSNTNYLSCWVRARNTKNKKWGYVHRFIYECFNGLIACLASISDRVIARKLERKQKKKF